MTSAKEVGCMRHCSILSKEEFSWRKNIPVCTNRALAAVKIRKVRLTLRMEARSSSQTLQINR
jgi:hypothetical protein